MYGIGTEKDERKGIDMLHKLSASGNAFASKYLSLLYKRGMGLTKDEEKSKQFFVLAQKRGIVGGWGISAK